MKESSSSGRWHRGQMFTPSEGHCSGHVMEVLNPSIMTKQSITVEKGNAKITRIGEIESVIARCTECFLSVTVPEIAAVPEEGVSAESYSELAYRVFEKMGEHE